MRVFYTLVRVAVIIFFVGVIIAISQYNRVTASSATPTPMVVSLLATPTFGLESGSSSSDGGADNLTGTPSEGSNAPAPTLAAEGNAVLPINGEWTMYPVVTWAGGVGGTGYVESNTTIGSTSINITASADSITVENLTVKPLVLARLGSGVYAAHFDTLSAEDRQVDDTVDTVFLVVDSSQKIWLVDWESAFESSDKVLLLALPGKPIKPDPRYGDTKHCPGALDPLLKAGDKAVDVGVNNNNLRADSNQSSKLIGTIKPDDKVDILQGPICGSNLAYWQVNVNGLTGWTADSQQSDGTYWLLPEGYLTYFDQLDSHVEQIGKLPLIHEADASDSSATPVSGQQTAAQCPGSPVPRLTIGGKGRVLPGDPNLLNTQPRRPSLHPDSKRITGIPGGGVFDVLEGPECADGITWWQVKYQGFVGWTGESDTSYWVEPVDASSPK